MIDSVCHKDDGPVKSCKTLMIIIPVPNFAGMSSSGILSSQILMKTLDTGFLK